MKGKRMKNRIKMNLTKISPEDLVYQHLPADYKDSYMCDFQCSSPITADDILITFWTNWPFWIEWLFRLRDLLIKPFGLQKGEGEPENAKDILIACIKQGGKHPFFHIPGKSEEETIMCADDKHLKFYMAVRVAVLNDNNKNVKITTLVRFHNWFGRAYFTVIFPFHHLLVHAMTKRTIRHLTKAASMAP